MRIGSLCSGYGGLDLAVESVFPEAELSWYFENDPSASLVMAHHWPDVTNYQDITEADWSALPAIDILTAGFPCQDISNAGKRVGLSGEKSGIWKNVAEAIGSLRPALVFLENVSAILRRGGRDVVGDLAEVGYDARWLTLRASDIDAPHQRNRWFCIAYPSDAPGVGWPARRAEHERPSGELYGPSGSGHPPTEDSFLLPYSDSVGRDGGGRASAPEGRVGRT